MSESKIIKFPTDRTPREIFKMLAEDPATDNFQDIMVLATDGGEIKTFCTNITGAMTSTFAIVVHQLATLLVHTS